MLEMGRSEQQIARQAYTAKQPLPDAIANAPELQEGLGLYLEAFLCLDTERSDGPIPWSAQVRYAEHYEFDDYQTETLLAIVKILDPVMSQHRSEKLRNDMAKRKSQKTAGKYKKAV